MISEAEKAAKVLEIAAKKSPVAQASLLESKKLIAEATQLIESIEMRQIASDEDEPNNSLLEEDGESETEEDTNYQEQQGEINGTHTLPINGESLLHLNMRSSSDLPTLNIEDREEDIKHGMVPQLNGARVYPAAESNGAIKLTENHQPLPNGSKVKSEKAASLESGNVTKKWVRGRLVEVTEAA